MTTELVESFSIQPITYPVMRQQIEALAQDYMALTVDGIEDKDGLKAVHDARMEVKGLRIKIEKRRKELKAESLEYGRKVDDAAKELTALISPVEKHLEDEESIVERERERIYKEEEARRQKQLRERLEALAAVGHVCLAATIEFLSDEEYGTLLADKTREKQERDEQLGREAEERRRIAEQQRIEAERLAKEKAELDRQRKEQEAAAAEAKRKEDERLAAERAEIDRIRKEQEAAQAKIDAENRRIAEQEAARQRAIELEKARQESAERARQEAEAKAKREAEEARRIAEEEEAERLRIESLRPDHEKILAVAEAISNIQVPQVSAAARAALMQVDEAIEQAATQIRGIAHQLVAKRKGRQKKTA